MRSKFLVVTYLPCRQQENNTARNQRFRVVMCWRQLASTCFRNHLVLNYVKYLRGTNSIMQNWNGSGQHLACGFRRYLYNINISIQELYAEATPNERAR